MINFTTGEFIPNIPLGVEAGVERLIDHIMNRRRKQQLVDSYFSHLHNVVCDPGYVHPQFENFIHPGNKEAVRRLVNKWFLNLPIIRNIAKATGTHVFEDIKTLSTDNCKLEDAHLAENILAIGSAKSTLTSQKALGYDIKGDDRLFLSDRYKGILRWEFEIDYNDPVQVKQKIEDIGGDTVLPDPHITKFRYLFYDTKKSDLPKSPQVDNNSQIDEEYAVLTKIPNRIRYAGNRPERDVFIFQGLHSVGTKSIEGLIWKHIDRIKDEFIKKEIDTINDSYQILFWMKINRQDDKPTKAFQPILDQSQVVEIAKLENNVNQLPDYT
ncbi:MAG: hypothetical protein ACT4N5_01460 [Nitrosopumilaceae archaeon]